MNDFRSPKKDLVFTRTFAAPVERVWQAWADPELVKRWWGPDGFTCPLARIDLREGGVSLVCMDLAAACCASTIDTCLARVEADDADKDGDERSLPC